MEQLTTDQWIEFGRTISLTIFLLYAWYKEREDRLDLNRRFMEYIVSHPSIEGVKPIIIETVKTVSSQTSTAPQKSLQEPS